MVRYLRRFKMFAGARTLWNSRDASLSPPLEPELTLWVVNQPSMWLSYTKGMITFPLCLGTFTFWLLGSCKKDNSEMAMRPQTAWNDPAQASTIWGCHNGSPTSSTRSAKVSKPYKKKKNSLNYLPASMSGNPLRLPSSSQLTFRARTGCNTVKAVFLY